MEDIELISRLKCGDEESFREIVHLFEKQVLNNCYRFVNNRETAEDLTQDVFIEVYRSINLFRNESKLSTWIYRIAVSKSLDFLKSQKRKKRFGIFSSLYREDNMEEKFSSAEKFIPDKDFENKERMKLLTLALDKLPQNQRIAITLSKYNEMSYQEIADVLNVSIPAVESLIHRAKEKHRKKLFNYYNKHL